MPTEKNLRSALASAEQLEPCVLWIDEIEKGLAGDEGSGDGGVSRRVLGYLLTWMAERKSRVFLVATANQIEAMPPELLRKGRFDEVFFVDLPDAPTREQLFALHLRKRALDPGGFDLAALAAASDGFSGAEIEQAIVAALYTAHRGRHAAQRLHPACGVGAHSSVVGVDGRAGGGATPMGARAHGAGGLSSGLPCGPSRLSHPLSSGACAKQAQHVSRTSEILRARYS